ncbi:MAG TPA: SRPBCC family protein [Acidobacteriota bacterium]|nr:SRPBCC family protein [Acidobacteriota bacterium]
MSNEKSEGHELREEYLIDAPRADIWRCWTDPRLLEQWFHPESWTTQVKVLELRPGGASRIIMRGPNGEVSDGIGVFLEVVPERRLVFTNAYTPGWIPSGEPSEAPLRTMIIEMSDEGDKTRYVVRSLHWSEEARRRHEEMGFHRGWKQTTRRLEVLARSLQTGA